MNFQIVAGFFYWELNEFVSVELIVVTRWQFLYFGQLPEMIESHSTWRVGTGLDNLFAPIGKSDALPLLHSCINFLFVIKSDLEQAI